MNIDKVRVITSLFVLVLVGSLVSVNTVSINNLAFAGGYGNKLQN